MMHTYSFDIFDTVLFRILADPKDIFFVMGRYLFDSGNEEIIRLAHAFHHIRVFSEFKARRLYSADDVKFDDIYRVMQSDFHLSAESIRFMKNVELEVEEKYIVPNKKAISYLNKIRATSEGVIFISDMYLPTEFIKKLLKINRLLGKYDRIYVSGDRGFTKSSGRLFKDVLKNEHIGPDQLRHIGDNYHSDYAVPRSLGIKAELLGTASEISSQGRFIKHIDKLHYVMNVMWAGMMSLRYK